MGKVIQCIVCNLMAQIHQRTQCTISPRYSQYSLAINQVQTTKLWLLTDGKKELEKKFNLSVIIYLTL